MNQKKYHEYSVEDFLNDKDFIRFVKFNLDDDIKFWNRWVQTNPNATGNYSSALEQLNYILSAHQTALPPLFLDKLWTDIKFSIAEKETRMIKRKRAVLWISSMAASLLIAAFSVWYFTSEIVIRTGFGETKMVSLDDSTKIRLNANSTLTMSRAFKWKNIRSVELQGEAYFKVRHLNINPSHVRRGELFVVNTKTVQVQVLGTEFNVQDRREESKVALISGRVMVKSLRTGSHIIMQPGNIFKSNMLSEKISPSSIQSISPSSWIEGKLVLKQAKVSEIIAAFQDLYGYKVMLDDPKLLNEVIDGTISIKDESGVMFTLSNILHVNIKKEGNVITLKSKR
ncbi:FecR family protein [Pedobacter sp. BMA]|uniref:FecR family protein n=1 Tax=Pedobacter sp. BMA TaxID=1663685 RepID=UPI000649C2A7|nr:FecR family protein [Pedobacter sp. BMA]KLT66760.1 hypothetical protein AB669_06290 [Pedobacter sp. BMA]